MNDVTTTADLSFIRVFTVPVFVIDSSYKVIAQNDAFSQCHTLLDSMPALLNTLRVFVSGEQERAHFVAGHATSGEHFVLTSLPLQSDQWLIKAVQAQSSDLAKRYQNLLAAIDQMSDALLICDHHNDIDLMNQNMERLFPFINTKEYQNRPLEDFVEAVLNHLQVSNQSDMRGRLRYVKRCIQYGRACSFSFKNADGRYLEYRDRVTHTGERIGLIIDETELKRLNTRLREALVEASELSEAKSHFMAAMSHEVRTPLNAIIGLLDLCLDDYELSENELLTKVYHNAEHLMRLINDVLDFSKFEADKVELSLVDVSLRNLCEQVVEEFVGQAEQEKAFIKLFVDPSLSDIVTVDDIRLMQVLNNLVSNALKFNTKPRPRVSVRVERLEGTGLTRFSVEDNGIGIPEDQRESIFIDFTQASPDIHRRFGGSGLGLSICQKICELMGSKLQLKSEVGIGSKFYFDVSLLEASTPEVDTFKHIDSPIILECNDEQFTQALKPYSPFLNITCKYITPMSGREFQGERENTYTLLNPLFLNETESLENLTCSQLGIIYSIKPLKRFSDYPQIQRMPLKLSQILAFLSRIDAQDTTDNKLKVVHIPHQMRVLVVEDNEDNMFVLQKQFSRFNVNAQFAVNAEDAKIFFEQQTFNLVITDYQMPGELGSDLIRSLRQWEVKHNQPTCAMLVLTADRTPRCMEDCLNAGADDVLMKPLTMTTLAEILTSTSATHPFSPSHNEQATSTPLAEPVINESVFIDEGVNKDVGKQNTICLNTLKDFIGEVEESDYRAFLQQFSHNLTNMQNDLNEAVKSKNWTKAQKLSHSLKSSTLIVGAKILSQLCEKMEEACADDIDTNRLTSLWEEQNSEITHVLHEVEKVTQQHD
ncbi:ATP-binding protein [Aestuariibacter sp. AA17]|uniref:histidine kinase n=1 Tax=Fluctibacter corallii TaxID=2984329 RepID=A0ABT3A7N1_9ALTE|nr:ATP-binding protein [Aestuariibacter sp. AA17]MCV2884659.1 ATP-binding protein [Aestuariibacter sp. AA17]